jgi:hypothetical protein
MNDATPDDGDLGSMLERLDVALAGRLAARLPTLESHPPEDLPDRLNGGDGLDPTRWITGLLGLRGVPVNADDVALLLSGRPSRLLRGQQEHALVVGASRLVVEMRGRARSSRPPDGWWLVECFRTLTREIPRFRNNEIRRDVPWDAILYVPYPGPSDVRGLLDTFDIGHRYRDQPVLFDRLHPVRRALRILWRIARIAPFPDFNLPMAVVAMNAALMVDGYPAWTPQPGDRELLTRLVAGPPPQRVVRIERALLELALATAPIG